LLYSLLLLFSCGSVKTIDHSEILKLPDILAFITFKITNQKDKRFIKAIDITKTTGKPKTVFQNHIQGDNRLIIQIKYGTKVNEEIVMEHPIFKSVEYTEGDIIKKKELVLEEETFFIRSVIKEGYTTIDIYELTGSNKLLINSIKY
jgi:hypothetical protein